MWEEFFFFQTEECREEKTHGLIHANGRSAVSTHQSDRWCQLVLASAIYLTGASWC